MLVVENSRDFIEYLDDGVRHPSFWNFPEVLRIVEGKVRTVTLDQGVLGHPRRKPDDSPDQQPHSP